MSAPNTMYRSDGQDKLLPRLGVAVYNHARIAATVWLLVLAFGIATYTVFLQREGFPSVNIPLTVISGAYLVNDPAKVDSQVARPISEIVLKDSRVKNVVSNARGTFYSLQIQYKNNSVDTAKANRDLQAAIANSHRIPAQATVQVQSPKFGFTERGDDLVISTYLVQPGFTEEALAVEAQRVVGYIKDQDISSVQSISVIDPYVSGVNPATGKPVQSQRYFDRYGTRQNGQNQFYNAVSIGITQKKGTDVIKLDERLAKVLQDYTAQYPNSSFRSVVSATYATDIRAQINELQRALLEGLLAVLVIGSLVIAVRASLITVLSMLTVLATTVGVIYLIGYTLNTITLFALILCLGLIVDDTIIMVEAIDAQRRRLHDAREVIGVATRKVSRAMIAATFTASLSFAPLIFVSGILGGFIRAIPITVIISLLVSLTVALVFIPLFSRSLLLRKKQLGARGVQEPAAGVEAAVARFIGKPMEWGKKSRKRIVFVGLTAMLFGLLFIGAGVFVAQKVAFNIFPPSKDSNGLTAMVQFAPGTTIPQAKATTDRIDKLVADKLGSNFVEAAYYENANEQQAVLSIRLIPYNQREVRAPQLRDGLNRDFANFTGAKVNVLQADVGPPPSQFVVRIQTTDRQAAYRLADDMASYLKQAKLTRPSGETARIKTVTVADSGTYTRSDNHQYVAVTADFDATDTSTLVTLAKSAVTKHYTAARLAGFGLPKDVLQYDIGQEQENQDSFKTLALAFPILLVVIFLLLAIQFRSLLQPLLIFMAIPFSLFGISLGLYLSDNPFSFFAALGFFALIGLSLKNSILLTDYANQLRRDGVPPIDAAIGALHERFRPLIATSFTAVVSLIPLAIMSPFWEGLAIVLIAGLLSSTFLVITVFPYYYLGAEFLRICTGRLFRRIFRRT